ncbi:Uncharacterised protein [Mycobacteroides abscessus]|nr:Uncharacterised protein [Mycobacteroides abscessus]
MIASTSRSTAAAQCAGSSSVQTATSRPASCRRCTSPGSSRRSAPIGLHVTTSSSAHRASTSSSSATTSSPRRRPGSASRSAATVSGQKLCATTRSAMPAKRIGPVTRRTCSTVHDPLSSSSRSIPGRRTRRSTTSPNVGTRWPPNAGENHDPASSARIAARSSRATVPLPDVVASTVSSWMTTGSPSAVSCTSISMLCAPARHAASNAASVFCGATELLPRCAMTRGGTARPGAASVGARAVAVTGTAPRSRCTRSRCAARRTRTRPPGRRPR